MLEDVPTLFIAGAVGGITSQGLAVFFELIKKRIFGRNQDTKEVINDALCKVADICTTSQIVWSSPGGEKPNKAQETVCLIQELSALLDYIWDSHKESKDTLKQCLLDFHHTVTGDDFDSNGREAKPEKMLAIRGRASSVRIALMKLRRKL